MKKTFKTAVSLILAVLIAFSGLSVAFAAGVEDALTFTVSSDNYAIVSDCSDNAQGVITIPTKVTIGAKSYQVKYIGEKAFDSCYSVTQINIPEGVTSISNHAFRDCVSLKEIYIPKSLVICRYDAFDGCGKVTVHCYSSNYQFFTIYGISANLIIDILDSAEEDNNGSDGKTELGIIDTIINAIKNLIVNILRYFNVLGENEDIELPFNF